MNTTENNIRETNVLIAEFMGINKLSSNVLKKALLSDLDYHLSWDSLMPVIEKIESLKENLHSLDVQMCVDRIAILVNASPLYVDIRQFSKKSKIEAVYKAVIEFIKWYNENSAKKE